MDLLQGLNPAQKEAVTFGDGPLLVLAGPGSGKTRVITHRVAHLIHERAVPPHRILAVTFTNKAADEMYRRLELLAPGARPFVSTFHKFCARILREYGEHVGLSRHFTILDQQDRARLLLSVANEIKVDLQHITVSSLEKKISHLKNELVSPEEFQSGTLNYLEQHLAPVYALYQQRLQEQDCADFDDLLYHVAQLLRSNPEIRKQLDRRFQYILIDEYQDTNLAQYAIAKGLSVDYPNICATGDPDQSIYSWRGANLRNILQFEEDFPGAHCVRLEQNYRSTGHILSVADHLIQFNTQRKHKRLITDRPPGMHVKVRCYRDDTAEASDVVNRIIQAVQNGERQFRDFAVLVRTTGLTRPIEAALRSRHVPYQVIGGTSFFELKEIRDLLAYGRLIANPRDDTAFNRIVNIPARGIGKTSLDRLSQYARQHGLALAEACRYVDQISGIRGKPLAAIRGFRALLDKLADVASMSPCEAMEKIIETTGYRDYLFDNSVGEEIDRMSNLDDLLSGASSYETNDPEADFVEFLESISLVSDVDQRDDAANKVTVMTLHAAKGLEFPVVHLVAFEHDILPHRRAVEEENVEEERRLLFVAVTRAQEELMLSYAQRRQFQGTIYIPTPSPFLNELPATSLIREDLANTRQQSSEDFPESDYTDYSDYDYGHDDFYQEPSIQVVRGAVPASRSDLFRKGMIVTHPEHGEGQILQIEGTGDRRKAVVHFFDNGTKTFFLSKSNLEPVLS